MSHTSGRRLGCYDSEKKAKKRLQQIAFFKKEGISIESVNLLERKKQIIKNAKRTLILLILFILITGCCNQEEEMSIHGRPFWGAKIVMSAGALVLPVIDYELDGELAVSSWLPYAFYQDYTAGYTPPLLTFCGYPDLIGPPPVHSPTLPFRVYYSYTGNGSDWQLLPAADYTLTAILCISGQVGIRFPNPPYDSYVIDLYIFSFDNADAYLPLPTGTIYLMVTDSDPAYNSRLGISPKVIGVTPV